jgi:hypothetical protein
MRKHHTRKTGRRSWAMASEIVDKLRMMANVLHGYPPEEIKLMLDAADAIEQKDAEIARLKQELREKTTINDGKAQIIREKIKEIARLKKYARTGLEIKCEAGFNLSETHQFNQDDRGEFTLHVEDNLDSVEKHASVRGIVNAFKEKWIPYDFDTNGYNSIIRNKQHGKWWDKLMRELLGPTREGDASE